MSGSPAKPVGAAGSVAVVGRRPAAGQLVPAAAGRRRPAPRPPRPRTRRRGRERRWRARPRRRRGRAGPRCRWWRRRPCAPRRRGRRPPPAPRPAGSARRSRSCRPARPRRTPGCRRWRRAPARPPRPARPRRSRPPAAAPRRTAGPSCRPWRRSPVSEAARRTACASPLGGFAASAAAPRARVVPKSPSPATSSRRSNSSRSRRATPAMVRSSWSMVSAVLGHCCQVCPAGHDSIPVRNSVYLRDPHGSTHTHARHLRCVTCRTVRSWTPCTRCGRSPGAEEERRGVPQAPARRRVGRRRGRGLGRRRADRRRGPAGTAVRVAGRFSRDPRYGSCMTVRRLAGPARGVRPGRPAGGAADPYEQMSPTWRS